MWGAVAIGAGLGAILLALFSRGSARFLASNGYLALVAMLAIYIGARLVAGSLADILFETLFATVMTVAARLLMQRWLPGIGVMVLIHGAYDALVGPHTGVADWYPPLCAGFDLVVGAGLIVVLMRKLRDPAQSQPY